MLEIILPIAVALITAIAAVMVACITAYKTKKLAYFQVYFEKKISAYSDFWSAVSKYNMQRSEESQLEVTAALHMIALLSSVDIEFKALRLANKIDEIGRIDIDLLADLNDAMRDDLEKCRKMKFD